jgi:hypothetical protein
MSETRSALENIAHAFAGELEARDDRLAKLITEGFAKIEARMTALEQSDRNIVQAMGKLQGQVAALSRTTKQ